MLSAVPSFSWVGSRVMVTGQPPSVTSEPSARLSLWTTPSGETAYTCSPSGSAAGDAFVIWADPSQPSIPGGVYVHRMCPWASSAIVLP